MQCVCIPGETTQEGKKKINWCVRHDLGWLINTGLAIFGIATLTLNCELRDIFYFGSLLVKFYSKKNEKVTFV